MLATSHPLGNYLSLEPRRPPPLEISVALGGGGGGGNMLEQHNEMGGIWVRRFKNMIWATQSIVNVR